MNISSCWNISCFSNILLTFLQTPKLNDVLFYPLKMVPGQIIGLNGSSVLLLSLFHQFQICTSGYLVPSQGKQMECYPSVSAHLVLHTLITTIHTGHPPASTCTLQTQTCNIFDSSDFKCIHLISIWLLALAYSGQAERRWWPSQKYRAQSFQLSKAAGQTSDTLSNHETLFHKTSLNPVWRFDTVFGQKSFSP